MRFLPLAALLGISAGVLADELRRENFGMERANDADWQREDFAHAPVHAKIGVMADQGERHRIQRKPLHREQEAGRRADME